MKNQQFNTQTSQTFLRVVQLFFLGGQVEEVEEEEETEDISKSKNIKMSMGGTKKAQAGKKK